MMHVNRMNSFPLNGSPPVEVKGDAAIATLGQQSERPRTAWDTGTWPTH